MAAYEHAWAGALRSPRRRQALACGAVQTSVREPLLVLQGSGAPEPGRAGWEWELEPSAGRSRPRAPGVP